MVVAAVLLLDSLVALCKAFGHAIQREPRKAAVHGALLPLFGAATAFFVVAAWHEALSEELWTSRALPALPPYMPSARRENVRRPRASANRLTATPAVEAASPRLRRCPARAQRAASLPRKRARRARAS